MIELHIVQSSNRERAFTLSVIRAKEARGEIVYVGYRVNGSAIENLYRKT